MVLIIMAIHLVAYTYFGGKVGVGGSVLIWKRNIVDKERITTD